MITIIKHYIEHRPATLTVMLTFLAVGLLFIAKIIVPEPAPLFNWPRLLIISSISVFVISVLKQLHWQDAVGLTSPISTWRGKWYLASIPLLLIACLSLTSVDWEMVEFNKLNVSAWILSNLATGFFEEVLMRGLCFYILLKAWGTTKSGVFKAALFQALIFGLAHLGNLYHMPVIDVVAQVIFATLIGIGFAGLVYLSKSLWPAIIIHSMINATGSINQYLVSNGGDFQSPGVSGYLVIIVIFLLLSTIPGLLYLRSATKHLSPIGHSEKGH